jgi:general secretion pathway protein K
MTRHREQGVALLLVLVFVAVLSVIVVEFCYEARVEAALVSAGRHEFEALTAARSAVASGVSLLASDLYVTAVLEDGSSGYDSLEELWATGLPMQSINEGTMQCSIDDEWGKLNLNALFYESTGEMNEPLVQALRFLFTERGAEQDPVDAILDWIDPDSDERAGGAESPYYAGLEGPYGCKNGPLDSLDELLLIQGITPELFFGDPALELPALTELLTVHGHHKGKININTAELAVLDAFGSALGEGALGEAVISERQTAPFISKNDITTRGILPQAAPDVEVPDLLVVMSRSFRVRGQGLSGKTRVRIDAYISRDERHKEQVFRVLDWRVIQ